MNDASPGDRMGLTGVGLVDLLLADRGIGDIGDVA